MTATNPAANWFLKVGNQIHGPMSVAEVRQKAAAGLIGPATLIRKGTDGQWVRAETVQGLFQPWPATAAPWVEGEAVSRAGASSVQPPPLPSPPPPQKPDRIHPATWAAVIVGAGTVLLLLWALVFRGSNGPQQQASLHGKAVEGPASEISSWKPLADAQLLDEKAAGGPASEIAKPAARSPIDWNAEANRILGPAPNDAGTPSSGTSRPVQVPPQPFPDNAVYEKVVPSVVIVCSFRGATPIMLGSGFVLDPGDRIVTNEHVIHGASIVKVYTDTGESGDVTRVIAVDAERDIAVLPIPQKLSGGPGKPVPKSLESYPLVAMPALRLAAAPPKVGDTVFALGSPKGLDFTFTKGIVSQFRRNFAPYGSVVQTDVSLSSGSSGGPLVDRYGQVVGVNTLASRAVAEAHNLNFAVSAEEISAVCKRQEPCALSELRSYLEYQPEETLAGPAKPKGDSDPFAGMAYEKEREEKEKSAAPWRQLTLGMTSAQVEGLLGRPNDIHTYPAIGLMDWDYRYPDHISRYEGRVDFIDGRLSGWREPMDISDIKLEGKSVTPDNAKREAKEQREEKLKVAWRKLTRGMSPTQVEEVLGRANYSESGVRQLTPRRSVRREVWFYSYPGVGKSDPDRLSPWQGRVDFIDGRLSGWEEPMDMKLEADREAQKSGEKQREADEAARWREWTKADGTAIGKSRFSGVIAGNVKLERENGEVVSLALDDLSKDDQAWVHNRTLGGR